MTIIQQYMQQYLPPPNVKLGGTALISEKVKKYAYGYTAFIQLALNVAKNEQGEVKYHIEDGRMIPMRAADYTFLKCNRLGIVRTLNGDSNEDLNFFEIEIPKYIRWYLWEEETQEETRKFFEIVALKGLTFLKEISYKDNPTVQARISYWMKLIEIAIASPITKANFEKGLNEFLSSHSTLNDRIIETSGCFNETDTPFGKKIKKLIKNEDLLRINQIFEQAYLKKGENQPQIEAEIINSYVRYSIEVRAATRQTFSIAERYTQIALLQQGEEDPVTEGNDEDAKVLDESSCVESLVSAENEIETDSKTEDAKEKKLQTNLPKVSTSGGKPSTRDNGLTQNRGRSKNNSKKNSIDVKKPGPATTNTPEGKQDS